MDLKLLLLNLFNFAYIGLLPQIFFKRGSLNPMWWLTGSPFFACCAGLILHWYGVLTVMPAIDDYLPILEVAAMAFNLASCCLISFTLGTHRVALALWHQADDAPKNIVTYGAYRKIRHPFYAAFILAFIAAFLHAPHFDTLVALLGGTLILNVTASREERRLCASEFGAEYQAYMQKTGRFFPKFVGVTNAQ